MNRVVVVDAADTHDLRRRVLRSDDPEAEVDWPGDDEDDTWHLAIVSDAGEVVAVSTWLERRCPLDASIPARQLRGMATDPGLRGTGLGAQLLEVGRRRARRSGVDLLWANARVEAVSFYERQLWTASGPVFATVETGLPHRLVTFTLG